MIGDSGKAIAGGGVLGGEQIREWPHLPDRQTALCENPTSCRLLLVSFSSTLIAELKSSP